MSATANLAGGAGVGGRSPSPEVGAPSAATTTLPRSGAHCLAPLGAGRLRVGGSARLRRNLGVSWRSLEANILQNCVLYGFLLPSLVQTPRPPVDLVHDRGLAQSTRLGREALRTQFDLWLRCRHAVGLLALLERYPKQISRALALYG